MATCPKHPGCASLRPRVSEHASLFHPTCSVGLLPRKRSWLPTDSFKPAPIACTYPLHLTQMRQLAVFCFAIFCSSCASYSNRTKALHGDMTRYTCCNGACPCSGKMGEQKCPKFCLAMEVRTPPVPPDDCVLLLRFPCL
jgi:hypothetical protein